MTRSARPCKAPTPKRQREVFPRGSAVRSTRTPRRRARAVVPRHVARTHQSVAAARAAAGVRAISRRSLTTRGIWPDLFVTVYEWVVAFAIAAVAAASSATSSAARPMRCGSSIRCLPGLYSIPAILLFPLYLLFFGLGPGSKIAIGTTIAFFPIVLNTIAGLSFVDRAYITAARSMGASGLQLFWSVMLPAAFPVVLTGLAARLHHRVSRDPRRRDDLLARRSRTPHRFARREHGIGADVRQHPLRDPDRLHRSTCTLSYAEARGRRGTR